jgi:hypothetical protein
MYGLVVRVALRKHVPLGAGVEIPQHRFQDATCWNGFAAGTTVRNIFLRKVLAIPLPLLRRAVSARAQFTAPNAATE